jgi:hypothetical protein
VYESPLFDREVTFCALCLNSPYSFGNLVSVSESVR